MGKLNQIDKTAESKGSGIVTLWQFVKFIFVSLGACIVQFTVLAILYNIPALKELSTLRPGVVYLCKHSEYSGADRRVFHQ